MAQLLDLSRNKIILHDLKVARSFWERFSGLLFSACPKEKEGLLFENCNSIHCMFMRYSIGVIFLDKAGLLKKKIDNLKPWRFAFCKNAWYTIELNPDYCKSLDLKIGDQLEVQNL